MRAPDVLVVATAAMTQARVSPDQLLLAVEVASTGTRRTDRVMKLHEYAQAGIPHYWIVDNGPQLEESVLSGEVDEHRGTHRGAVALLLDGRDAHLTVSVDLDAAASGTSGGARR